MQTTTPLSPRTLNKTTRLSLQRQAKQDVLMVSPLRQAVCLVARPEHLQISNGNTQATLYRYYLHRQAKVLTITLPASDTPDRQALLNFLRDNHADQSLPLDKIQFKFYKEYELDSFLPALEHFQFLGRWADHQALCTVSGYSPESMSMEGLINKCTSEQEEPNYRISIQEWWHVQEQIEKQKQEIELLKSQYNTLQGAYIQDTDGLYIDLGQNKDRQADQLKELNKMVLLDISTTRQSITTLKKEVQHIMSCGYGADQEERIRRHKTRLLEDEEGCRLLEIEIGNLRHRASQDQHELVIKKQKEKEELEEEVRRLEHRADPAQEGLVILQRQNQALEERLGMVDSAVRQLQVRRKVMMHQA